MIAPAVRRCPCCGHISNRVKTIDVLPPTLRVLVIPERCKHYGKTVRRFLRMASTTVMAGCFALVVFGFLLYFLIALIDWY